MSDYPAFVPTARSYSAGNWPIKTFNAQNGVEMRILYGNRRFGHSLALTYENIADPVAEEFIVHYINQQGTYKTFALSRETFEGYQGPRDSIVLNAGYRTQYRYAEPTTMQNVFRNRSIIQVKVVAVLLTESI